MRPEFARVVLDNKPYLVVRNDDGSLRRAFGPFQPGTEPSLAECSDDRQVHEATTLSALEQLLPISPALPSSEDTLAGG